MQNPVIYALKDPLTNKIRYVGKTIVSPRKCLYRHLRFDGSNPYKDNWLRQLKANSLTPKFLVLEHVYAESWEEAERQWIKILRKYQPLTNLQDGGRAPPSQKGIPHKIKRELSKETKRKVSEGLKTAWARGDFQNRKNSPTRKPMSTETKRKISKARKGKPLSKAHRQALKETYKNGRIPWNQGRPWPEKTKRKMAEAGVNYWKNRKE